MAKRLRKNLGMMLVVCMIISCLTGFGKNEVKSDQPLQPVKYLFYDENTGSFEERSCNDYVKVRTDDSVLDDAVSGWYVVDGMVVIGGMGFIVVGNINLILKDDCVLTTPYIGISGDSSLTIYGQGTINGTDSAAGKMITTGKNDFAGIGFDGRGTVTKLTINGGEIIATGGEYGAGIGGCKNCNGGNITINGGRVTARGGVNAAGIGGGSEGAGGNITITGGEVTAIGGSNGAGIGSGYLGNGGTIAITGGKIAAFGGGAAAGIGGGSNGNIGNVNITGGMIEAVGSYDSNNNVSAIGKGASDDAFNLDSAMRCFESSNEESEYGQISSSLNRNGTKKYAILYKNKSGIMTASGSAITAKYINEYGVKQSVELTIKAPSEIDSTNENGKNAALEGVDDFNRAIGKTGEEQVSTSQIMYYDESGQLLGGVPTAEGNYTAKITVDDVTAAVGYAIAKKAPIVTVPISTSPIYTGDAQELITAGSTTGGTLKYSLSEDGIFSTDIPTATEAGTYTVYYMVEGNNEYKSTNKYSVTAGIRKARLELSLTQDGWIKGEVSKSPVLIGNAGTGDVTYAYKKDSESETAYVNSVPAETGNYVVRATVSETANYAGGTALAEFSITEPAVSAPVYQPVFNTEEPKPVKKVDDGLTTTTEVKNPDGTISDISVTKPVDGSIIRETVRDEDGKFVEYNYEYSRTSKNGTTLVQTFNEKADGSKEETSVTTTKSGTVSAKVKEQTAEGTVISKEEKKYADGRSSIKKATIDSDGVTSIVTEKTNAAGVGVKAEYTPVTNENAKTDATETGGVEQGNGVISKGMKISLKNADVSGTNFKLPDELWVNEQLFVVTEIGKDVLKNNKTVTKLTIGENVISIGSSAFKNMTNLKSISLDAANLQSIGKNAFKGVGSKKHVTIRINAESQEQFEKICDMIRAAGAGKKVKFVMI